MICSTLRMSTLARMSVMLTALCVACDAEPPEGDPMMGGSTGGETTADSGDSSSEPTPQTPDPDSGDSDDSSSGSDGDTDGTTGEETTGEAAHWHRVPIEVADLGINTLYDVPIMVRLTPDRVDYAVASEDGSDLRFVDPDGVRLRHEVERWNPGGTSVVWVDIPELGTWTGHELTLEYGRVPPDEPMPYGWNAYGSVWHFQGEPIEGASTPDSGGPYDIGFEPSADGIEVVEGIADQGYGLHPGSGEDDSPDRIATQSGLSLLHFEEEYTWEMWINPSETTWGTFAEMHNSISMAIDADGHVVTGMRGWEWAWRYVTSAEPLPPNEWSYVVARLRSNPSTISLYVNGEYSAHWVHTLDGVHTNHGGNVLEITGWLDGGVDEMRLSDEAVSNDWIRFQYLSMTDALLSFGDIEELPQD